MTYLSNSTWKLCSEFIKFGNSASDFLHLLRTKFFEDKLFTIIDDFRCTSPIFTVFKAVSRQVFSAESQIPTGKLCFVRVWGNKSLMRWIHRTNFHFSPWCVLTRCIITVFYYGCCYGCDRDNLAIICQNMRSAWFICSRCWIWNAAESTFCSSFWC